jgi:hypothetical protein
MELVDWFAIYANDKVLVQTKYILPQTAFNPLSVHMNTFCNQACHLIWTHSEKASYSQKA